MLRHLATRGGSYLYTGWHGLHSVGAASQKMNPSGDCILIPFWRLYTMEWSKCHADTTLDCLTAAAHACSVAGNQ